MPRGAERLWAASGMWRSVGVSALAGPCCSLCLRERYPLAGFWTAAIDPLRPVDHPWLATDERSLNRAAAGCLARKSRTAAQGHQLFGRYSTGNKLSFLGMICRMPKPPNIDIKGPLVRKQRNHLRLTQQELARRVYLLQGKSHIPDQDTLERRCRDWEVSGKISRQTLSALATALGLSVAYLLDGEAPDPSRERTSEIADRLRDQVVVGATPAIEFIAAVRELSEMGAIPQLDDDAAAYWQAARALECRLGAGQLTSDRAELATVANILDWNTAGLYIPAAVHPYWLIQINCTYGERLHLVRGTESAANLLDDAITTWCQDFSGEGRAILVEEGPWFRIHLEEGNDAQFDRVVSIVRCEPGYAGLNYTKHADEQRTLFMEAVLPSLQPHFRQIGQLKFTAAGVLTEQAVWPVSIRDFIGPIQPLWVRGVN